MRVLLLSRVGFVAALCPGQNLLKNPADPSEFGPWPVSSAVVAGNPVHNDGSFTSRKITAEVFFPAKPGSEEGAQQYTYSPNAQNIPPSEDDKIPPCPADNPHPTEHVCCEPTLYWDHMYSNLPLDTEHGPYPVIIFIHGTAAWRSYMLHLVALWVSRGFVVFAADYPGITMHDMIQNPLRVKSQHQIDDTKLIIEELNRLAHPSLAFLNGHIDMTRLGITGHSAGGFATGLLGATNGQVLIPMSGGGTFPRQGKYSSLIIGGQWDTVVDGCELQHAAYLASPTPKRHLCVARAGHETYTDLCWAAPSMGGIDGIGRSCGVKNTKLFEPLADQGCRFAVTAGNKMALPEEIWPVVRYATAGTFEETLLCDTRMVEALRSLPQVYNSSYAHGWMESLGEEAIVV